MRDVLAMQFEWDDAKRRTTIEKHKIDFVDAAEILNGRHVILPARSEIERRQIAVGELNGKFITVVFTMRGDVCRIITARSARPDERLEYQALYPGSDPADEERN